MDDRGRDGEASSPLFLPKSPSKQLLTAFPSRHVTDGIFVERGLAEFLVNEVMLPAGVVRIPSRYIFLGVETAKHQILRSLSFERW